MDDRWFRLGDHGRYPAQPNTKSMASKPRFRLLTLFLVIAVTALGFAIVPRLIPVPPVFLPLETAHFSGKTLEFMTFELGEPSHEWTYAMNECVGELRVTLFNTYPPSLPNLADIEIRELTWDFPQNKFTVWFHRPNGKWTVLETFSYETEAVF